MSLQCDVAFLFLYPDTSVRAQRGPIVKLHVECFKHFMHNFHKSTDFAEGKKTYCKAWRYLNIRQWNSASLALRHL